ncbi:MAG: penicillin acylase family protein [Vulcanimicrobiaceae bacterium]
MARHLKAFATIGATAVFLYVGGVLYGMHVAARTHGVVHGLAVTSPIQILRDERDVPHIRAANEHDLFFAQGYAQASDRLFQMELMRRFIFGRLAEVLGPKQLPIDEAIRAIDARDIVSRQWRHLDRRDRDALRAFSDGINAAIRMQPLPVEFRLLLYQPEPWTPQDSLGVTLALSVGVSDSWHDVFARDAVWRRTHAQDDAAYFRFGAKGSNAWGAGAARTATGRALLANDPHLDLSVPGIWYIDDLRAPGFHVAGASIPGVPGVVLGHNERVAWAVTTSLVSSLSVFDAGRLARDGWTHETFHVRFGQDVTRPYYRTAREFAVPNDDDRTRVALVRWTAYADPKSAIETLLALDGAQTLHDALRALAAYPGPSQNFIIASVNGEVTYHLAGEVLNDPAWGRYVHPARDLHVALSAIPFERLPQRTASRDAVIVSANNRMFDDRYPYRLSAAFAPPYRAERIERLLRSGARYTPEYFARMQLDTLSLPDLEFAHRVGAYARTHPGTLPPSFSDALATWDGRFAPHSRAATLEHALRETIAGDPAEFLKLVATLRAGGVPPNFAGDVREAVTEAEQSDTSMARWSEAGAVRIQHQFGPLGFSFLNGATLPGEGDEYTVHVQTDGFAQSFRAVWDVGKWDAGGIVIPSGESGEPGSAHYSDLSRTWIRGSLVPLPFTDSAVRKAGRETLELSP